MKLRHLQCLCTLVDSGWNVSRAAQALHATQPAIGKQLRQFEQELGIELFRRQGARIVGLTRSGEEVLRWARTAMLAAHNIRQVALDATSRGQGAIVIGTTHTHARYVLLDAFSRFSARFPEVRLHLLQGTPEGVAAMVRDGRADVGVTSVPASGGQGLHAVPFLEVRPVLVVPIGHPLLDEPRLTLEAIARHPLIGQNVERPLGAKIDLRFRQAGIAVRHAVEAPDADVMKSYVRAGLGIAIIPGVAFDPELDVRLAARELGDLFEPTVSCVLLRPGGYVTRAAQDFLELLSPRLERHLLQAQLAQDG